MSSQTLTLTLTAADGATQNLTVPYPPLPSTAQQFPLLGALTVGGQGNFNTTGFQQLAAKFDYVVLGPYYGEAGQATFVNAIKAVNPNILLGLYAQCCDNIPATQTVEQTYMGTQKGPNGVGDWWLYNASGTRISGKFANWTSFVTPDANGDRVPQYLAKWDKANFLAGVNWDVWFVDDWYYQPRVTADYQRSGTNDPPGKNNTSVSDGWYRSGMAAYATEAKALMPAGTGNCKYIVANTAGSDLGYGNYPPGYGAFPEYSQLLHGCLMEGAIGYTWSVESFSSTATTIGYLQGTMNQVLPPKLVQFAHNVQQTGAPTSYTGSSVYSYQDVRYGFAMCLVASNAYYTPTDNGYYWSLYWFDEFDLAGTATTKWLGTAVDPPQTAAWSNGVWMRRFAGGIVLMNPKGNGVQTVTPPTGYKHFIGTQVPTVNNGAAVTGTVTLADRDGLLLVKV